MKLHNCSPPYLSVSVIRGLAPGAVFGSACRPVGATGPARGDKHDILPAAQKN